MSNWRVYGETVPFLVQKGSFLAISHYVFNECRPNTVLYSIAIFVVRDRRKWPLLGPKEKSFALLKKRQFDKWYLFHPCFRGGVYEQSRSYVAFFRALPASTWGHYSQTLLLLLLGDIENAEKCQFSCALKTMFLLSEPKNPIKEGETRFCQIGPCLPARLGGVPNLASSVQSQFLHNGGLLSEKVLVSQERVSGFKGADLRGSPGNFRGSLGSFQGSSGLLLSSTVKDLPEKSPKNFRGSSGNFRGSPGTFQKLGGA